MHRNSPHGLIPRILAESPDGPAPGRIARGTRKRGPDHPQHSASPLSPLPLEFHHGVYQMQSGRKELGLYESDGRESFGQGWVT
jgi:hypothetical protein